LHTEKATQSPKASRITGMKNTFFPILGLLLLAMAGCGQQTQVAEDSSSQARPIVPDIPASPDTAPPDILSGHVMASGTEPFWNAELYQGWVMFSRLGLAAVEDEVGPSRVEGGERVWNGKALQFRVAQTPCTDGMSDTRYPLRAVIVFDDVAYQGCAREMEAGNNMREPAIDWSAAVAAYEGGIDGCLGANGPGAVTELFPREGGLVSVRLWLQDGNRVDCASRVASNEIIFMDPLEPFGTSPAARKPANVFLRIGMDMKVLDDCYQKAMPELVTDDVGLPLGTVHANTCDG